MRKDFEIGKYYATRLKKKKLEEEYYNIENEYNATTKAMGVSDSLDSDIRENPEFMELRVKAMYAIPQKKSTLYEKLRKVIIIEEMDEYINFDNETVIIGSTVELIVDGEKEKFTILGNDEGDLENDILSANAPLIKKVLGHKVGETVFFNDMKIEILSVSKYITE